MSKFLTYVLWASVFVLGSCDNKNITNDEEIITKRDRKYQGIGKFFGEESLLFTTDDQATAGDVGIGVNAYLWRASLDTISFMPLRSVDPFGGVILTNWYTSQHKPNERLKVDILILDRQLRADGLKISVFRQELKNGHWVNAKVNPETARELEDAILTRARQLKINANR